MSIGFDGDVDAGLLEIARQPRSVTVRACNDLACVSSSPALLAVLP